MSVLEKRLNTINTVYGYKIWGYKLYIVRGKPRYANHMDHSVKKFAEFQIEWGQWGKKYL